ncbi:MAG: response regulator [Alphaproteobacteria bacterium]|nr:response regulator [Alphaproteobacteria bacterium]
MVDDSAPIRFALGELLGSSGYAVLTATNGGESLQVLDELARMGRPPEAVVADLVMDDLPGYDVIKHAKRTFPAVPVIAISGGTRNVPSDLPLDLARRSGADLCLSKPFSNDEFIAGLRTLIGKSTRGRSTGA